MNKDSGETAFDPTLKHELTPPPRKIGDASLLAFNLFGEMMLNSRINYVASYPI